MAYERVLLQDASRAQTQQLVKIANQDAADLRRPLALAAEGARVDRRPDARARHPDAARRPRAGRPARRIARDRRLAISSCRRSRSGRALAAEERRRSRSARGRRRSGSTASSRRSTSSSSPARRRRVTGVAVIPVVGRADHDRARRSTSSTTDGDVRETRPRRRDASTSRSPTPKAGSRLDDARRQGGGDDRARTCCTTGSPSKLLRLQVGRGGGRARPLARGRARRDAHVARGLGRPLPLDVTRSCAR